MPSVIEDTVFSEPSGRPIAVVMVAGALLLSSTYAYYAVLHDISPVHLLVMAGGFALSGIAESLPSERRRAAGALRVAATSLLLGLLGLIAFAPDVVLGSS